MASARSHPDGVAAVHRRMPLRVVLTCPALHYRAPTVGGRIWAGGNASGHAGLAVIPLV